MFKFLGIKSKFHLGCIKKLDEFVAHAWLSNQVVGELFVMPGVIEFDGISTNSINII